MDGKLLIFIQKKPGKISAEMERKIAKVITHVKMEDEDYSDVLFWRSKSMDERLNEVVRLRKNYYMWLNGVFPEKMIKDVTIRPNDF
jgi:hypothetical protein